MWVRIRNAPGAIKHCKTKENKGILDIFCFLILINSLLTMNEDCRGFAIKFKFKIDVISCFLSGVLIRYKIVLLIFWVFIKFYKVIILKLYYNFHINSSPKIFEKDPRGSMPHSQSLCWAESTQFLVLTTLSLRSILIFSSCLRLDIPKDLFPIDLSVQFFKITPNCFHSGYMTWWS